AHGCQADDGGRGRDGGVARRRRHDLEPRQDARQGLRLVEHLRGVRSAQKVPAPRASEHRAARVTLRGCRVSSSGLAAARDSLARTSARSTTVVAATALPFRRGAGFPAARASSRWLCCVLEFKGIHRVVMKPRSYTELFSLDEATALAAR